MLEAYRRAGLVPLLESIRMPGRYQGVEHLNVLTNCLDTPEYDRKEVWRELESAHRVLLAKGDRFTPNFSRPGQGFSEGLNPYTDWALSQLDEPPDHAYLFLGVDWDSVTSLGTPAEWEEFSRDPFAPSGKNVYDRYWHNVWAWILDKTRTSPDSTQSWATPVAAQDAAAFIRADKGAFIFHNLIPYLRPAGEKKSGTDWYWEEWKKANIRRDVEHDLTLLRKLTHARVFAFCTNEEVEKVLLDAGYTQDMICRWGAHPSRYFHPSTLYKAGTTEKRFLGPSHFGSLSSP